MGIIRQRQKRAKHKRWIIKDLALFEAQEAETTKYLKQLNEVILDCKQDIRRLDGY